MFNYQSIKKAQTKKAKKATIQKVQANKAKGKQQDHTEDDWVPPPPPISPSDTKRANTIPQDEGPSTWSRVDSILIVVPSSIGSHPAFLSMKKGTTSLWGKDFNPSALIQSSMLSQLDHEMEREACPLCVIGLRCLLHDKNLGDY